MRCVNCGTALIEGKRFCHACGTPIALACRGCGSNLQPEFRFCPDCGLEVTSPEVHDSAPPPTDDPFARMARHIPEALAQKIRAAQGTIEGERKQVTVLFCDLVGSTSLAEKLDPEEYHDLLDEYLALVFQQVSRCEGLVNVLAGDGFMALFGAPIAHEDAPRRAVASALAIRDAIAELGTRLESAHGLGLRVRIGIHTGPVVVGTVGNDLKMDYTAIGDTTNLASRLQTLAEPGSVLVSDATQRLIRGFFELRPTGPLEVRGKSEPVLAYEAVGETTAATPMAIAAERGLTPLVGRDEELAQLAACYARAAGGVPQVVAVVGEAGSGKSRLLYEFRAGLEGEAVTVLDGRCSSLGQTVPYSAFTTMLRQYFDVRPGEPACAKVAAKLGGADDSDKALRLVARFLALPTRTGDDGASEAVKRESFDAIARLLLLEAQQTTVVLMLEDLHWIDDASRELLDSLLGRLGGSRIMALMTHRPDDRPPLLTRAAFTQIVLRRLDDDDVRRIIRAVAGSALPESLERLLVSKAEGSPFFAEEITRGLIEEGHLTTNGGSGRLTRPVDEIRIPGTVQEVIAARLDRLGPQAKRVAQVAAVLGRQFQRTQLGTLLDGEGIDVTRALGELEARGIVHRKSLAAGDEYRFGESLTQEVAYEGLLLKQRRQLHERIGLLLESSPGEPTAERSALLAHHFARSDNRAKAVEALLRAADDAAEVPSYRTSVELYQRAWELAETDDSDERFRRAALAATRSIAGFAALLGFPPLEEADRAARRGRELAEALGDTEALSGLLYTHGVITMLGDRDDFERGMALAEQGLATANQAGLKLSAMRLSRGLAINYVLDGRFDIARRAMDWVMAELDPSERDGLSDLYLSTRWVRDSVLYMSDDLDAAQASVPETYAMARRAPNRTVTNGSASTLAALHFIRGNYAEALHWADDALEVAEAIANVGSFPGAAAIALASRHELGRPLEAARYLELIDQGLAAGRSMQSNFRYVADGLAAAGDLVRIERVAGVLRGQPGGSGRLRQAYGATTVATLLFHLERLDEAERAFHEALVLAETIGARSTLAEASLGAAQVAAGLGDVNATARHVARALDIARAMRLGRVVERAARLFPAPELATAGQP